MLIRNDVVLVFRIYRLVMRRNVYVCKSGQPRSPSRGLEATITGDLVPAEILFTLPLEIQCYDGNYESKRVSPYLEKLGRTGMGKMDISPV